MERLPQTEFGRTLRTLIRDQWKSQASFAEAIGVDETWVSSVIRARQVHLTYASLLVLLSGFHSASIKDELYEAWLVTYAPSPSLKETPEGWSSDEEIVAYARSVHDLISAGKVLNTFKTLGRLWLSLRSDPDRYMTAISVGGAYAEAAQQLDRIPVALRTCNELIELSLPRMEPSSMTRALWLRGVSLRLVRPRNVVAAESALNDLATYLEDWQPRSAEERAIHWEFSHVAARDQVLSALDLFKAGQVGNDLLSGRVSALLEQATELNQTSWIGLASEVAGRALIAAGRPDEAKAQLMQAARLATTKANELKVLISELQLLISTDQLQEVSLKLYNALDIADEYRLVHHRNKLAVLQRQLDQQVNARTFSIGLFR